MDLRDWTLPGPSSLQLDLADLAKFFSVSQDTIWRWIEKGQFPCGLIHGGKPTWTGAEIAAAILLRGRYSSNEGKPEPQTDAN
jgi:predicted DNA-binding transcriptional regulator AlpA